MHVSILQHTLEARSEHDLLLAERDLHSSLSGDPAFRWAMLLRSATEPTQFLSLCMWLTLDAAAVLHGSAPSAVYEVATARGSMTPCSRVAIVEWSVAEDLRPAFVSRWNAEYHRLEDAIGSRLLQHVAEPATFAGLHVARADGPLEQALSTPRIKVSEMAVQEPASVRHFEVLHLTEA